MKIEKKEEKKVEKKEEVKVVERRKSSVVKVRFCIKFYLLRCSFFDKGLCE